MRLLGFRLGLITPHTHIHWKKKLNVQVDKKKWNDMGITIATKWQQFLYSISWRFIYLNIHPEPPDKYWTGVVVGFA